jgi:isovaleryl-CoA dehydrogenase
VLAANAERVDKDAEWPKDSLHAIAAAGLMGLHVPRNFGGLDEGLFVIGYCD